MKKSETKRKKNRRMKKAVRRTLGSLFMISAIITAAIPFPEAQADPVAMADGLPYSYPTSVTKLVNDAHDGTPAFDEDFISNGTAYTLANRGNWQLDWQFEYYAQTAGADGYITKYNNQYSVNEIELDYRVYSDYVTIEEAQVSNYYSGTDATTDIIVKKGDAVNPAVTIKTLGHVYVLTGDPTTCPDHDFFYDNFNDEYNQYKAAYDAAELYKDDPAEAPKHPYPEDIRKTYKNIYQTDAQQMQFFCDQVFGSGTPMAIQLVDKRAYNSAGEATGWEKVYIPRLLNKPDDSSTITIDGTGYYIDNNAFLANKFATIIGIAKEAFQGVTNVKTLNKMATEISYIGDSAFEDSYLESITLPSAAKIGNQAFKNCGRLTSATLPDGVRKIGAEAFSGTPLNEITIPDSVTEVGEGAFYNCNRLGKVTFTSLNAIPKTIHPYAFYDCSALTEVNFGDSYITKIGEAAFALSRPASASLGEFCFPNHITQGSDLGQYVLGRRDGLKTVVMPSDLGNGAETTIPDGLFWNCTGLTSVIFPETCGYVNYGENLFRQVATPTFYVRGPKEDGHGGRAKPRESTWNAYFNTDQHVPYVYTEDGQDYYEVSNGDYILLIDSNGILNSCNFIGSPTDITELTVPTMVGTTPVTGIKDGCFSDPMLGTLNYIEKLIVDDSQITSIGDNVFYGAQKLKEVEIGNSVQSIGQNTFANCPNLEKVHIGNAVTQIGAGAFKGSSELETVIFDPPKGGISSFPIENIGSEAFSTGGDKLTIQGEIASQYGPFAWAMQSDNYMNRELGVRVLYQSPQPSCLSVILDNQNNYPTLVDYPHYEDLDSSIRSRYESNGSLTPAEEALVKSTLNIVVPDGIKSIDAKGYFNNSSKNVPGVEPYSNSSSISAYFNDLSNEPTYRLYGLFSGYYGEESGSEGRREFPSGDSRETEDRGNDRIQSISMSSVEYLPDGCFYSCEGLETVNLGSAMADVGLLPFENCTALTSCAGNSSFVCNNGILYENLANGTKRLVECFPSRGSKVGPTSVSVANDSDLSSVSEIAVAAFRGCKEITNADFTGSTLFDEIPEECFYNCESLNEVDLPQNVRTIGDRAFANTGAYTKVIVRGREVSLGRNAFENVRQAYLVSYRDSGVREAAKKQGVNIEQVLDDMFTVKFYTYDGKTLIKSVQVAAGGTAEAPEDDEIPERAGWKFVGWSRSLKNVQEDFFVLAVYEEIADPGVTPGVTPGTTPGVTPGTTPGTKPGTTPGTTPRTTPGTTPGTTQKVTPGATPSVSPTGAVTKYNLTVVYGSGSGDYAPNTTVIISAIDPPAGKVFDKWVSSNSGVTIMSATSMATTVKTTNSDATVTATYKNSGTVSANTIRNTTGGGAIEVRDTSGSTTRVDISRPGISNTDKAYASVNGSTDNFIVKVSESDAAANEVATALSNTYSDMNPIKYFAMDISLYDSTGTAKIQNTAGLSLNITMPLPDALVQYAGNNKVGAVINGSLEPLNCKFLTVDGIPCVSFTATHFSPYTIYVDTAHLTEGILDTTPKTGDGIHPKWFLAMGFACISMILFLKKDKTPKLA